MYFVKFRSSRTCDLLNHSSCARSRIYTSIARRIQNDTRHWPCILVTSDKLHDMLVYPNVQEREKRMYHSSHHLHLLSYQTALCCLAHDQVSSRSIKAINQSNAATAVLCKLASLTPTNQTSHVLRPSQTTPNPKHNTMSTPECGNVSTFKSGYQY